MLPPRSRAGSLPTVEADPILGPPEPLRAGHDFTLRSRSTAISLTLAAVGAILIALLQNTIVPFLEMGGAVPDLLLVYVVILAIVVGLEHGIVAAFMGGTTMDALATRPFGSTAFVLLVAVGIAVLIGRVLARGRSLSVLASIIVLGVASPLLYLVVYGALRVPIPVVEPAAGVVPDMAYSAVLGAVFGVLASRLHRRYFERERIDW